MQATQTSQKAPSSLSTTVHPSVPSTTSLVVKTHLKAGSVFNNHNTTQLPAPRLVVKTNIKAGSVPEPPE